MSQHLPNDAQSTLTEVMVVMEQLVQWLIRTGVGYTEFSAALKPVFFRQAMLEAQRVRGKQTDSAISLLSGLHRRDVHAFRMALATDQSLSQAKVSQPTSVPARVIGLWLSQDYPDQLPFAADADQPEQRSFEGLVRQVSNDRHPRAVCLELERLGVVQRQADQVVLERRAFIPDPDAHEAKALFAANVADHIAAGVHNFSLRDAQQQLEQAIFADELTAESIAELEAMGSELWEQCVHRLLQAAVQACAADEGKPDAVYRYRFGAYQYREDTSTRAQVLQPQQDE